MLMDNWKLFAEHMAKQEHLKLTLQFDNGLTVTGPANSPAWVDLLREPSTGNQVERPAIVGKVFLFTMPCQVTNRRVHN